MIERGNFLVYIEGERIDFENISISLSPNTPSSASIGVSSSFSAPEIVPYSLVHIFYWDGQASVQDDKGKVIGKGDWFLLWEGVTVGNSYKKNPMSSSFNISCMDLLTYMYKAQVLLFDLTMFDMHYAKKSLVIGGTEFSIKANTFEEWAQSFFTPGSKKTYQQNIESNALNKEEVEIDASMLDLIKNFINKWYQGFPILDFHMNRLKLSDKFNSVEDDTIGKFFNMKKMQSYINNKILTWQSGSNVLDLVTRILQTSYYNYINTGPCMYSDKKIRQFILKPNSYFMVPPKCNIIFPDMVEDFNSSTNHLDSVTRTFISANIGTQGSGISMTYVGPKELEDFLADKKDIGIKGGESPQQEIARKSIEQSKIEKTKQDIAKNNAAKVSTNTNKDGVQDIDLKVFYTKDEIDGFVNVTQNNLDSALATIDSAKKGSTKADGEKVDTESYNDRIARLSQYYHDLNKYGGDSSTMVLKFSPQLVANFPAVYLDKNGSQTSSIASITHSISADGSAFTTVNMNLVRELRIDTDDVDMPPYLSTNYSNRILINDTYETLLGCKAITQIAQNSNKYTQNDIPNLIAELMNEIFALDGQDNGDYYESKSVGKAIEFINNYTKRNNIATLSNVKEFYGLRVRTKSMDGNDESWESTGSGKNPFDYSAANSFLGDKLTPNVRTALFVDSNSDQYIEKEHKKNKIIELKNKFKGIINGR